MTFFLNEKVRPVSQPPETPRTSNQPDRLEFKAFGLSFTAVGRSAIRGALLLASLAFVLMTLFPNAIAQAVGLTKLLQ